MKEAFFFLQTNKSLGHDEISFNVIKSCFGSLDLHIFRLSLEEEIFTDDLRTAKVTPIFKAGDENDFDNYRPIYVLFCFSKIIEKIMYKRLYGHLLEHNILDPIMFADDTNPCLSPQNINTLFRIFNEELKKMGTGSKQTNYP